MIDFKTIRIGDRNICIGGVGKLFYQEGFPLSICISEFHKQGIEVSLFHLVDELWKNGWEWKTIEMKLKGEMSLDIDSVMNINFDELFKFYSYLEQPERSNGGYEKSREIIFQYLFGFSSKEAIEDQEKRKICSSLIIY